MEVSTRSNRTAPVSAQMQHIPCRDSSTVASSFGCSRASPPPARRPKGRLTKKTSNGTRSSSYGLPRTKFGALEPQSLVPAAKILGVASVNRSAIDGIRPARSFIMRTLGSAYQGLFECRIAGTTRPTRLFRLRGTREKVRHYQRHDLQPLAWPPAPYEPIRPCARAAATRRFSAATSGVRSRWGETWSTHDKACRISRGKPRGVRRRLTYAVRVASRDHAASVLLRNSVTLAKNAPAGSRSLRSHRANVPGSTPICRAASFCVIPSVFRPRTRRSAQPSGGGNGL